LDACSRSKRAALPDYKGWEAHAGTEHLGFLVALVIKSARKYVPSRQHLDLDPVSRCDLHETWKMLPIKKPDLAGVDKATHSPGGMGNQGEGRE